jgi:hypothetical protein
MTNRSIVVFTALLLSATTAQAGNQLFEGSWTVKAFGNECSKWDPSPGPSCPGYVTGESEFYSAWGMPQGIQCNPYQPRCPLNSTPTDGAGNFNALGGYWVQTAYCAPWNEPKWGSKTMRPAKGATALDTKNRPIPPLYRNPAFFTLGGHPDTYSCTSYSSSSSYGPPPTVKGSPITGRLWAVTTGTGLGGFSFPATGASGSGLQGTRVGDLEAAYPYIYNYTYATLRNDAGLFGPGQGPGSFSLPYKSDSKTVAKVVVKQGVAKFGGTMRMLGQLTSKACYFRNGGCSISSPNWRYEAIGAAAYTSGGVVTRGYQASWCEGWPRTFTYGGCGSYYTTISPPLDPGPRLIGSRFPWTTGSVTVTARGRGPHKTVHHAKGYDNRTPTSGRGTIQLVSPTLTRWLQPCCDFETGGIGIFRIKFLPEPQTWAMLVAGISLLAVGYRMRGR